MQQYQCHKRVRASKITQIVHHAHPCPDVSVEEFAKTPAYSGANLLLSDDTVIFVDADWMKKHAPQVGGYYIEYADGYLSYSPAGAFESGYTRTV